MIGNGVPAGADAPPIRHVVAWLARLGECRHLRQQRAARLAGQGEADERAPSTCATPEAEWCEVIRAAKTKIE
jgi:membrane protein required for beta-lactamase induction